MEKDAAVKIITSRKLIVTPGLKELKVTSVQSYNGKFIVNFAAMTDYHQVEAKKLGTMGDYQGAVNQQLTASLRPTDYIPSKGEICKVYVDNITTRNNVTGLFVTSVSELKADKTESKVSKNIFSSFEEEPNEDVDSSFEELKVSAE